MSKLIILFLRAHNNIKTRPCLSDIKWLQCRFVNSQPKRGTHKTADFLFFYFFCKTGKAMSFLVPFQITKKNLFEVGEISVR